MRNADLTLPPPARKIIGRILRAIRGRKKILCSSHVRADGDGLGSALAMARLLRKMGKKAHVVCEKGAVPEYAFIPQAGEVGSGPRDLWEAYDAVMTFDCANVERLESVGRALPKDLFCINIDHHVSNTRFGSLNWVDDAFASTTEMVYMIARQAGAKIDPILATQLYVGLVTDTGHFSMSNTSVRSHGIAAELMRAGVRPVDVTDQLYRRKTLGHLKLMSRFLRSIRLSKDGRVGWALLTRRMTRECGYDPNETQEFVNQIKSIRGVRAAVLLHEMNGDARIRISWRTSDGIDGAKLAACFGGGGHRRASGALIKGAIAEVERAVVARTLQFVRDGHR